MAVAWKMDLLLDGRVMVFLSQDQLRRFALLAVVWKLYFPFDGRIVTVFLSQDQLRRFALLANSFV